MIEAAIFCLALTIYHEARGEPILGQAMVSEVLLNRAKAKPSKVCEETFKRKQFSYANGKVRKLGKMHWALHESLRPTNMKAWAQAKRLAVQTLQKPKNLAKGSTFYHATYVKPKWASRLVRVATVGQHIFYRKPT